MLGEKKDFGLILFASAVLLSFILFTNVKIRGEQQFSFLARSFLAGKLYFLEKPGSWGDAFLFNGHYYWLGGLLPALILVPFVYVFNLFGIFFYQNYLHFPLVLGVFFLVFKIAERIGYKKEDSLYLAVAFCFASVFVGVAAISWSWYFAQVLSVFLLLIVIWEYLTQKRYKLIGLIFALILLTRVTASLGIVFFALEILYSSKNKLKDLLSLMLPFLLGAGIWLGYNYIRFGNALEGGYCNDNLPAPSFQACRSFGIFSPSHIPGNLYYLFLGTPLQVFKDNVSKVLTFPFIKANPWGMSIFITSPYYLYLFFLKYKEKLSKILFLVVLLIALSIAMYYGIGYFQYGYRYSLDFLPFLFFLLIKNYKLEKRRLSIYFKWVIVVSVALNFYLLTTLFLAT